MTIVQRAALILAGLAAATPAAAQRQGDLPRYKLDPYTRNEQKLLDKLGYVTFGPMPFGQRGSEPVTTDDIEKHLAYAQILWIETAHFRIGSTLESWTVPFDPETRSKIRGELEELDRRGLPRVNPKTRTIDRWLRVHLIAQRMEQLYADVQSWLGVTDDSFPDDPSKVIRGQGEYMGQGKYLGQTDKYLIFVFENVATCNDYLKSFTGRNTEYGQRWNFKVPGSLMYALAVDGKNDRRHDTGLHQDLTYNVTNNLIDGYRYYSYDLPIWIKVGIAHNFARKVSPRWNTFDQNEGAAQSDDRRWKWWLEVRKLIANGKYRKFADAYTVRDWGQFEPEDHFVCWSWFDFLMNQSQGKAKLAAFMKLVKGRVHEDTWLPNEDDLVGAARDALIAVYGFTPLNFEEKWEEWVKENYPTR